MQLQAPEILAALTYTCAIGMKLLSMKLFSCRTRASSRIEVIINYTCHLWAKLLQTNAFPKQELLIHWNLQHLIQCLTSARASEVDHQLFNLMLLSTANGQRIGLLDSTGICQHTSSRIVSTPTFTVCLWCLCSLFDMIVLSGRATVQDSRCRAVI